MKKQGFTLVELMIVVAILGILAAIALPEFQGHASQSRESAAKSSLQAVRCQIELYKMQHGGLNPGYVGTAQAPTITLYNQFIGTSSATGLAVASTIPSAPYEYGPYLLEMPTNPFNEKSDVTYVAAGVTDFSTVVNGNTGWLYQKETATFKLNYAGTDSQGTDYIDY